MATKEIETIIQAVLAELQRLGTNLQDTDVADSGSDFTLLLGFKEDGTFIRLSPSVLKSATTQYITESQYQYLKDNGLLKNDVEYNIIEE